MGEVIKGNFGGRKNEKDEMIINKGASPESVTPKTSIHDNFEDAKYAVLNLDRIRLAKERIDEITDYIFDRLEGYVRDDVSIGLRRTGLQEASMESLVGYIVDSTQQDWKQYPSFYGAVILEYQVRVESVMNLMKLDDE